MNMKLQCEECGYRVSRYTFMGEDGLEFGRPEQVLCEECHDLTWRNLRRQGCPSCHTQPCMHGSDCWINPFPQIMYLCHVGRRIGPFHPAIGEGIELLEATLQ